MTALNSEGLEKAVAAYNTRQDPAKYGTTAQDYGMQEQARQRVQMSAAISAYLSALPPVDGLKKEHPAVTKAREIGKKLASDPIFNSNKAAPTPTPVDGLEVVAEIDVLLDNCHWVEDIDIAAQHEAVKLLVRTTLAQASSVIAGLKARVSELEAAIDSAEIAGGLTENGNLWRFWSQKAQETAGKAEARISSLEEENKRLREIVKAVAHIGVDFGFGPYELEHHFIEDARQALEDHNG